MSEHLIAEYIRRNVCDDIMSKHVATILVIALDFVLLFSFDNILYSVRVHFYI